MLSAKGENDDAAHARTAGRAAVCAVKGEECDHYIVSTTLHCINIASIIDGFVLMCVIIFD